MDQEKMKRERPEHDEERMEMTPTRSGQYRVTCKCGVEMIIPPHQGKNGAADCTGKLVNVAWAP